MDLHEIWHVASLYPPYGQGLVSERRERPWARAPCAVYLYTPPQTSGKLHWGIHQ